MRHTSFIKVGPYTRPIVETPRSLPNQTSGIPSGVTRLAPFKIVRNPGSPVASIKPCTLVAFTTRGVDPGGRPVAQSTTSRATSASDAVSTSTPRMLTRAGLAISVRPRPTQHCGRRQSENPQVQPEQPILDVLPIEPDHLFEIDHRAPAPHLP